MHMWVLLVLLNWSLICLLYLLGTAECPIQNQFPTKQAIKQAKYRLMEALEKERCIYPPECVESSYRASYKTPPLNDVPKYCAKEQMVCDFFYKKFIIFLYNLYWWKSILLGRRKQEKLMRRLLSEDFLQAAFLRIAWMVGNLQILGLLLITFQHTRSHSHNLNGYNNLLALGIEEYWQMFFYTITANRPIMSGTKSKDSNSLVEKSLASLRLNHCAVPSFMPHKWSKNAQRRKNVGGRTGRFVHHHRNK